MLLRSSLLLLGCATVQVGGFTLGKGRWESDAAVVRKRAAWELKCPEGELDLTVLAVYSGTITAQQVGVKGCGHQLVYVNSSGWDAQRCGDGWLLNSSDAQPKTVDR
jgi:hypothetical protein